MTHGPLHDALYGAAQRYEATYVEAGAAPEKGLAARARRRRRTSLAATATASVAILGGGIALALPAISGDTSAVSSADLLTTVDIPLINYADAYSYFGGGADNRPPIITPDIATCGGPAPTTVLAADGFTWETFTKDPVEVTTGGTGLTGFGGFAGSIRYSGDGTLPVTVEDVAFVLVADGEVVGFANDNARANLTSQGFAPMREGYGVATGGAVTGRGDICTPGGRAEGDFPPGEYQAYPVLHIVATKQTAAVAWLGERGVLPPGTFADGGVYEPGSWDCAQQQATNVGTLVQCDPAAVGVELQVQSDSASVPYDSTVYARDVNVTLVGEPIAVTVRAPVVDSDSGLNPDYDPFDNPGASTVPEPENLMCGVGYRWVGGPEHWEDGRIQGTVRDADAKTVADGVRSVEFLPTGGLLNGSVRYPERVPVWFVGFREYSIYGETSQSQYTDSAPEVIGTGYALVNGGEPLALNRYDGPTTATVELTEVTSCGPGDLQATWLWFSGTEEIVDTSAQATTTADRFGMWLLRNAADDQ